MLVIEKDTLLKELTDALGIDYVSSDPAILVCYSRDQSTKPAKSPTIVVLPGSKEDIQAVVKIANRFKIPVIPRSTGVNVVGQCVPSKDESVLMDLKRMNKIIEIDEKNMTAIIEPGVLMAQLQAEAYKCGLKVIVPSAPGSVSVISNYVGARGISIASVKYGVGDNHIVGLEWILPDGTLLELGSVVYHNGWQSGCIGHSPGPDFTGLFLEAGGGLGICTKAKIKLYPKADVRNCLIASYNDRDQLLEALFRVQKAGVASAGYVLLPTTYAAHFFTLNNETARKLMKFLPPYNIMAFFEGTLRKANYEEQIFKKIVKETQGSILNLVKIAKLMGGAEMGIDTKQIEAGLVHQSNFISAVVRIMRFKGALGITLFLHNINDSFKLFDKYERICKNYGYKEFTTSYIQPIDDYHYSFIEMDVIYDQGQAADRDLAQKIISEINKAFISDKDGLNYYESASGMPGKIIAPNFGIYYDLLKKFKTILDPKNVMNPGVFLPK